MTRLRFTAAALSAAALGLAAVLVPTASLAEPLLETPAATPSVIWTDAAEDIVKADVEGEDTVTLTDAWQWVAFDSASDAPLADLATFGPDGLTATGAAPLALFRGLPEPVLPTDLPALVSDASVNAGADVEVGIFVQLASQVEPARAIRADAGFDGADTQWSNGPEGATSTDALVASLTDGGYVVVGYLVIFPGAGPIETPPPVEETEEPQAQLLSELLAEASQGVAARAAVPAGSGIASFRFADLTTYFTPQPTAVLTLSRASFTAVQASTTGIPVTGSGFAPGETVTVGLSAGASGSEVEGVTFIADADGNVSGTVVLPAGVAPGEYSLILLGASSSQFAASALVITADGAPVAVPVPGRANYAG